VRGEEAHIAGGCAITSCDWRRGDGATPEPRGTDRQNGGARQRARHQSLGQLFGGGNLSFSWRLVFAPEAVIDYVVAHEVAHLAEMNHGPRFWRVVASLTPEHATARAWLKRHRSRLLSYG
jgi:hypothetical protein